KVQKSLVYDLFSLARTRSPQKTCHNIAVALDRDPKCALYQRIKRLGFATVGRTFEPITQSTFVESLMPYISTAPKLDRDLLLRGKPLEKQFGDELFKVPLRNLFVEEKDLEITEIISNYLDAVRKKWPEAWDDRGKGMMLNRTNGFRALMRFFRNAYLDIAAPGDVPSAQKFYERVLKPVPLKDRDFTTTNFVPGTSGGHGSTASSEVKTVSRMLEHSIVSCANHRRAPWVNTKGRTPGPVSRGRRTPI